MITPDELREWAKLFNEYGWPSILFLMLLFLWFIPWVKSIKNKSEKNEGQAEYLQKTILGIESDINKILAQIGQELKCQWAVLWQFHNGTMSLGGVPFIKMSVTHEFVAVDYAPRADIYQGMPISVFIDAVIDVQEKGFLKVDLQDKKYQSVVNSYKRDGVGCGYIVSVEDTNSQMLGLLSMTWKMEAMNDLSEAHITSIKGYSARLSMLLRQLSSLFKVPQRRWDDYQKRRVN